MNIMTENDLVYVISSVKFLLFAVLEAADKAISPETGKVWE